MFLNKYLSVGLISILSIGTGSAIISNVIKEPAPEFRHSETDYSDPNSPVVNLNWMVDIPKSNILWETSFEEGDYIPLMANDTPNKITDTDAFHGNKSLYIKNTGEDGNFTYTNGKKASRIIFEDIKGLEPGMKFSATFKVKNIKGESTSQLIPETAKVARYTIPFHVKYNISEPIIVENDTNGSDFIKIQNFEQFVDGIKSNSNGENAYFVATNQFENYDGNFGILTLDKIDYENRGIRIPGIKFNYKSGEVLHHVFYEYPLKLGIVKTSNNPGKWEKYALNGTLVDLENYDIKEKGLKIISEVVAPGEVYVDDFKMGHATKVRVYKDDVQIFEGYESSFKDIAKDVTAPSKVSNINTDIGLIDNHKRTLSIELIHDDLGTDYSYKAVSVDVNGEESNKTQPVIVNVKTGVNGYSYLIDTNLNSEPDNSIDVKYGEKINETINVKNSNESYYLHIKSIDNAGNISPVSHIKIDIPKLSAVFNSSDNNVDLNWEIDDSNETFKYKVYRKDEEELSYKSISTYNYENTNKIEVLNLYPYNMKEDAPVYIQTKDKISFNTWDGENITLPSSASLKKWMEEPNSEDSKGYGKGLIEVTSVKIDEYNKNPLSFLKDNVGNWKYDVIFIGSWDGNAGNRFSEASASHIKEFVDDGRGLIFSHDTINYEKFPDWYMKYLDMAGNGPVIGSSEIYISKKSALNDFPWDIGDVGKVLNIPNSHTSNVKLKHENISMKFKIDNPGEDEGVNGNKIEEDETYSNNSYLSTYNNVALVETGHSNGLATSDEQKILANTIFYLAQITREKSLKDLTGVDRAKPSTPNILSQNINKDKTKLNVNFENSIDFGTNYSYYIEAIADKSGTSKVSNIEEVGVKSGIKGYSYEIDANSDTVPDKKIDIDSNENSLSIDISNIKNSEYYLHLVAIDNEGNKSDAVHLKVGDSEKPLIEISLSNDKFTNKEIQLMVSASDNTAVDYIILPNGQKISSDNTTYTVSENGVYSFIVVDIFGNLSIESITVNNIDKRKPSIEINKNPSKEWSNTDVDITIIGKK